MEKFLAKRRLPPHIRPELDIEYQLIDQSVALFEIRPQWDDQAFTTMPSSCQTVWATSPVIA
jgi:hypothetical protein